MKRVCWLAFSWEREGEQGWVCRASLQARTPPRCVSRSTSSRLKTSCFSFQETRSSLQHRGLRSAITWDGRGGGGRGVHVCVGRGLFAVHMEPSQHCLLIGHTATQNTKLYKAINKRKSHFGKKQQQRKYTGRPRGQGCRLGEAMGTWCLTGAEFPFRKGSSRETDGGEGFTTM